MAIKRNLICASLTAIACFIFLICPSFSMAKEEGGYKVLWGSRYQTMTIRFGEEEYQYPRDMLADPFPAPGEKPYMVFDKDWPVYMMWARWTEPMDNFPAKYRSHALDLVLMFTCDAQLYEHVYPEVISTSEVKYPHDFQEAAEEGLDFNLCEEMRGETVEYEITAKAGFGASDYKIRTKMRVGLSEDGKTVFFYDSPEHISGYLRLRDFFFAAHDAGDKMQYEVIMACVCKPGGFFSGETLNRTEKSGKYFVQRVYECLKGILSEKEIDDYLAMRKERRFKDINEIINRRGSGKSTWEEVKVK